MRPFNKVLSLTKEQIKELLSPALEHNLSSYSVKTKAEFVELRTEGESKGCFDRETVQLNEDFNLMKFSYFKGESTNYQDTPRNQLSIFLKLREWGILEF